MARREEYDWLEDPFDEAKNATDAEELERVRHKSRTSIIVLVVILAVIVQVSLAACAGLALIADSMG